MTLYAEIARALEAVSREERRGAKADLLASLIKSLPPELVCPAIRLISGRLWPPWEPREMGIGPEILGEVLEEIGGRVISFEARRTDPGDLAEMMVQSRSQQTLTTSTIDAMQVYDSLRTISAQRGEGSIFRKRSILMGLLLRASPLEAKYIARTVLRRTASGLGPSLMAEAIAKAFSVDESLVKRAYAFLPDLGMVAHSASRGEISEVKLAPPNPARLMLFRREKNPQEAIEMAGRRAYVVRYGGLRVQVHKFDDQVFIFTSQLRAVTPSLADLAEELMRAEGNFVAEGEVILVQQGKILPRSEILRRINLKGRFRGSPTSSFAAADLLYLNGEELIDKSYAERRRSLSHALGNVAGAPLVAKVFLAEEVGGDPERANELLRSSLERGHGGILIRDPAGIYTPGAWSRQDVVISHIPGA